MMKIFLQIVWLLILAVGTIATYYGAWQHSWVIILVGLIPTLISLGYNIHKQTNEKAAL